MRLIIICFLLMSCTSSFSQLAERISIKGTITVPEGFDPTGITVYNMTSNKGDVSSEKGEFSLRMAEGDSVLFSALQFKELKLRIDRATINSGRLDVGIVEGIDELPEIVIRRHSLTGDLEQDAKQIPVVSTDLSSMSAAEINDYDWEWRADSKTAPHNAAIQKPGGGANILGLVGAAVNLLWPKRQAKVKRKLRRSVGPAEELLMERRIKSRHDDSFFREDLNLPAREISNFLSFCMNQGLNQDLLIKGKELDLIQFFMDQRKKYDLAERN